MIDELKSIITSVGLKHYVRSIKSKPILLEWIQEQTKAFENIELAERIYIILNGNKDTICVLGNHKKFNTLTTGYRFCASNCDCRRKEQSLKIKNKVVSEEEKQRRLKKQKKTLFEKHGVDNPMHIVGSVEKLKDTNLVKYGTEFAISSSVVKKKIEDTNLIRYGVTRPLLSEEIREKSLQTNLERHGADYMRIARDAFLKEHGCNPFKIAEISNKAKETMFAEYGVFHALQNKDILLKTQETFFEKHGSYTPMGSQLIRDKLKDSNLKKYNRNSPNQAHISDDSYINFLDVDTFKETFKDKSLRDLALHLGVSYDTARKWCVRHNIDLPKSTYEEAIIEFLREQNIEVLVNSRSIIGPYEIDIFLPDFGLGIEFCGLYWHSDQHKDEKYHLMKLEKMELSGYRLITIFEDEWVYKQEIVKKRLLNMLGKTQKGYGARQLTIQKIVPEISNSFLEKYHIQGGNVYGFANYGAYKNDELVAVMTFSRSRKVLGGNSDGPIELLRFATDGRNHAGIASRMFNTFIKEYVPKSVISYADRRWSDGNLYSKIGFTELDKTKPNYWYFHPNKLSREYRFKFRKDRIKHLVENGESMSERQIMNQLGYFRIWDCGSYKFIWNKIC